MHGCGGCRGVKGPRVDRLRLSERRAVSGGICVCGWGIGGRLV